ncbi:hypothetical protein RIF29_09867 [Crotalaria pallida]|uniref:Uncharacterized protein n=1 Tax=Crotalaria pallida TaxID=3830 RepID=A0AAN9FS84_CROPI
MAQERRETELEVGWHAQVHGPAHPGAQPPVSTIRLDLCAQPALLSPFSSPFMRSFSSSPQKPSFFLLSNFHLILDSSSLSFSFHSHPLSSSFSIPRFLSFKHLKRKTTVTLLRSSNLQF